jgi:hypothetical protein
MARDSGEVARQIGAFAARFRRYSLYNTVLILLQHPGASWVQGRRGWARLGRRVRRGARPIHIRAPALDPDCQDPTRAFRDVRVHDVADTVGPEATLAPAQFPAPAGGELAAARLVADLEAWVAGSGLRLAFTPPNAREEASTDGVWIRVRGGLDPHTRAARLAHEIAHVLLHFRPAAGRPALVEGPGGPPERRARELEAELTAFLLLAAAGLDPTAGSAAYLANWGASAGQVEAAFPRCLAAASRVLRECRRRRYRRLGPGPAAAAGRAERACA